MGPSLPSWKGTKARYVFQSDGVFFVHGLCIWSHIVRLTAAFVIATEIYVLLQIRGLDWNVGNPRQLASGASDGECLLWDLTDMQNPTSTKIVSSM